MFNIVVFGKPRSFESLEFELENPKQDTKTWENSHPEPSIKPIEYGRALFHYFRKENIEYWEVYLRCKGFDSDRDGIILGVGIKSDKNISLIKSVKTITEWLYFFVEKYINNDGEWKFKFNTIVDKLKNIKWTDEDKQAIKDFIKEPIKKDGPSTDTTLLVANGLDELLSVEDNIKDFSDIYIADNADIFINRINSTTYTKRANGKFFIVKDGKICSPPKEEGTTTIPEGPDNTPAIKTIFTILFGGRDNGKPIEPSVDTPPPAINRKFLYAAALVSIIIIAVLFFIFKPKPADRIEFSEAPETGCITSDFNLSPKLLHGNSERTSTKLTDIVWTVEGDGSNYIVFDTINHSITFSDEYYIKKPKNELPLTITAKLNDSELGRVSYTLEKYKLPQADKVLMKPCTKAIKTEWNMAPILSCKGSKDVSTTLADIEFVPEPIGIVEIENGKLKVKTQPETETKVTVKAFLNGTLIGEQIYKIDKKEIQEPIANQPKVKIDGKILCHTKIYQANYNEYTNKTTFSTNDDITTYAFLAVDSQKNKFKAGGWICPTGITFKDKTENPATLKSKPSPGTYTLEYQVDNTVRAQITITITK